MSYIVRKQFKDIARGVCELRSDEDCFVPEMSLPIQDILAQFAYVDNMRLKDLAQQGYEVATSDEDDFASVDPEQLDLAEREELAEQAGEVIKKASKSRKKVVAEPEQQPDAQPDSNGE